MDQFAKERDRLLQVCARAFGLGALLLSLLCAAVPGVTPLPVLLVMMPFYVVMAISLMRLGASRSLRWAVLGLASGFGALVVAQLPLGSSATAELATALVPLAGGAMAAIGIVLVSGGLRITVLVIALASATALIELATPRAGFISQQSVTVVMGWAIAIVFGYWVGASVPRAARRIHSIGRAHRAERQASETEAQRRQSARLLHDTVRATLTLLAHSGLGVSADALRIQAGDDARLLRQLRLGGTPVPQSSEHYNLEPVEESALGHTLESVKQRFGRMGLEVSWHGTGQVLLPSDVLDAFLLALADCLENVRRHSGVTDAHVTITDDDTTVRAMVTDAGVGFSLTDIDAARLGFKDSVVGRLKEVGGNARLFSSPGAGTTVVLEVPR